MNDREVSHPAGRFRAISAGAGVCVFGIGCLVLSGWVFDIEILKSLIPGMITMKVNTAAAFVLAGISLWLLRGKLSRLRAGHWVAWGCAFVVAAVGVLSLAEYAFGSSLGIDQLLLPEPSGTAKTIYPGRMAPNTAFNFLLMGLSLLLLEARARRGRRTAGYLIGLGGMVAFAGLVGYICGASGLYALSAAANAMSLPAALAGVCAFAGLWLALPEHGLLELMVGRRAGDAMVRRLVLPLILVPILLDVLLEAGRRTGVLAEGMVPGVHLVLQTAIFLLLLRIAAVSLNRSDSRRLKAEEHISAQREWQRVTLGSIGDGVIATGIDGRITFMNPVAASLTGWPADEALGKPFAQVFRIVNEQTRQAGDDIVSRVLQERRVVAIANATSLTARDGREIPIEDSAAPITDDSGEVTGAVLVFHDVAERRRAQEALRKNEAALRGILDATQESIWVFAADGTVLMANSIAMKRIGKTPREIIGAPMNRLVSEELAEARMVRLSQVVSSGQPVDFEDKRSGMTFHHSFYPVFNDQGRVDSVVSFSRDITGQKQAEEALRQARDQLELRVMERTNELRAEIAERKRIELAVQTERKRMYDVMETLPVYVILLSEDYRVPYANRFFRERFGDSGGKRCYEYLFGRDAPCENCHTYKVLETNAPLEWEWTGPDSRNYSIHDFPFIDTDGSRLILEVGIDVTEEKRLRAGLERQTGQLRMLASELTLAEQRERRRLAQVLHDHLQQLLVGAKMRMSIMRRDASGGKGKVADEIEQLIGQSIDAARTLTAELSPPILHDGGLGPGLKWLGRWMKEKYNLDVTFAIAEDVPALPEDITAFLFQSVKELLFNTAKHAKILSARVNVAASQDHIRIVVSDDGAGFDQSQLTLHGGQAGGFGLFGISERLGIMGGSMNIETAPGGGTSITLISPLSKAASRPEPAVHEKVEVHASSHPARVVEEKRGAEGKIRVLLVDDHLILRQGLSRLLKSEADLEIVGEAADGETSIEMVRLLTPDVVLMDINMAGMNGVEATRLILAEFPKTIVIGLSMFEEQERAAEMRAAGASDYVTKSGKPESLIAAIRTCWKKRLSG